MLTDATLNDLEHVERMVREATDLDAVARAVFGYAAHDLATRIEQRHANVVTADCEDVDELAAKLAAVQAQRDKIDAELAQKSAALTACNEARRREQDTANVQLGALRSTLAELHEAIGHRYDMGIHAGLHDDPAPMSDDAWFMHGFKYGQAQADVAGLRQDIDKLRMQLSDAEAALEDARKASNGISESNVNAIWRAGFDAGVHGEPDPGPESGDWFQRGWRDATRARTIVELEHELAAAREQLQYAEAADGTAEAFWAAGLAAGDNDEPAPAENGNIWFARGWQHAVHIKLVAGESVTQNQTITPTAIIDATPAELAAVATATHTNGDGKQPVTIGGALTTKAELRTKTVESIKDLARVIGRTPTIMDWDADCRRYRLPTAQVLC